MKNISMYNIKNVLIIMDNKRLYEKLMNSIGYEVKKALNEGIRE